MSSTTTIQTVRAHRGKGSKEMRGLDRGARDPVLFDAPPGALDRVRSLRVAVVGLGSIGTVVTDLLARLGIASLLLVDRAKITPESLLTHASVQPGAIKATKVKRAGEAAKAVSERTTVRIAHGPVEGLPREAFAGLSAVVLASDNIACELEVTQRCLNLGVPLYHAAVHGGTLVAQVRALANAPEQAGQGACLACAYGPGDWEALDRGTVFSCAGGEGTGAAPERSTRPTTSPAFLCTLAATLAVNELAGRAMGIRPADDRLIQFCGFPQSLEQTPLERRPDCPVDHSLWRVERPSRRALTGSTPRELLARVVDASGTGAAAEALDGQDWLLACSLRVDDHCFTRLGQCGCSPDPVLARFVPRDPHDSPEDGGLGTCLGCRQPLVCHSHYTHETVPGTSFSGVLDHPLRELGASGARSVLARVGDAAVLYAAASRRAPKPVAKGAVDLEMDAEVWS